jgi:hypothetical protein
MQGKRKKVERKARAFRIIRSRVAYISVTAVLGGGDGCGCRYLRVFGGGRIGFRTPVAAGKRLRKEKSSVFCPWKGAFFLTMLGSWPIITAVFRKAGIL